MAVSIDFDAPFDAQVAQARSQRVTLPDIFYRLQPEKRAQAFTVSGLARLDQIQRVADSLAKAQAAGLTFEQWRKAALETDWNLPRHRLETIYRNAVQTAYMAGHWRRFDEAADDLPYLMYDAINDNRVRPTHLAMDGVIRPVNDTIWKKWSPPVGHRCRCTLRQVSRREALRRGGVTQQIPAEAVPDQGWGNDPRSWSETLRRIIDERMSVCDTHTLARKTKGIAMQCLPVIMREMMMARAATYEGDPLPPPKKASSSDIIDHPGKYKRDALVAMFRERFDRSKAAWMDEIDVRLEPDTGLFLKQNADWKIGKNQRSQYMLLFADALQDPMMVRLIERENSMPELSVLGHYLVRGKDIYIKLAYRWTGRAWEGWSAFELQRPQVIERHIREGLPIYVRQK